MTEDIIVPDPQLLPEAGILLRQRADLVQCQLVDRTGLRRGHLFTGVHGIPRDRFYGAVLIFFHRHPLPFPEYKYPEQQTASLHEQTVCTKMNKITYSRCYIIVPERQCFNVSCTAYAIPFSRNVPENLSRTTAA